MLNVKPIIIILLLVSLFSISAYSQKTLSADYEKKIREATPKPLPQSPVSEKLKSDAEDENLKGKVKTVSIEREFLSESGFQGRHFSSIEEFNEKGNRIKRLFYSSGKPFDVSVYGYIDRMRVMNSEYVKYESDAPHFIIANPNQEQERKPDPRYKMKFEYKYDDGKLTETKWIRSNGSLWMTYVYNYKGNQVEELVYDERGKLNQKYLFILDKDGNVIETTIVAVLEYQKAGGDKKFYINYDSFDKKGNWTKKTTSEVKIENGKEVHKPLAIEYRTITYYP